MTTMSPYPEPSGARRTSGKATAALVLGIVGLFLAPIISSTLAIVFGSLAKGDIARDPGLEGDGRALAGIILGIVGLIAGIVVAAYWLS